jgi:hypothetical protein
MPTKPFIDAVSGETVRTESDAAAIQSDLDGIVARLSKQFPEGDGSFRTASISELAEKATLL